MGGMAIKTAFIEPMLLLRMERLPVGSEFVHEHKLDGYRSLAVKTEGRVHLRSGNDKDFNAKYPCLVNALGDMPDETVLDGEVVALDADGRPSFNILLNYAAGLPLHYLIFDLLLLKGRDVMGEPLMKRRELIEEHVLVGQFEFVEWTQDQHLRHSRFVGLREDKKTKDVRRE